MSDSATASASGDANSTAVRIPITIARGDGIGPEIMEATLRVLEAAGAPLDIEEIEIGERVYERGISAGIESSAWESLRRTRVFLKAPITTPQGGGFKSLNVTTRKTLGLYANVRPCVSYHPFVPTKHPAMDVVVVRENEEDTYAGIEHRQTNEVTQCLKLISRPGCERIVRYAFEYAVRNGRKKVSCFVKDNIMKITDGLFRRVFEEIAKEYPQIETDVWIIDIGAARIADTPEMFDVVVTLNLYGDVISDITAQLTGSVGLGGSANIGEACAMFEAIHGSAPPIAGQDVANPSGILLAAVQMLVHIDQPAVAARIHNAWLRTLEDGVVTGDIASSRENATVVGTQAFADAVIERLGKLPQTLPAVQYRSAPEHKVVHEGDGAHPTKTVHGVDVFLDWDEADRDPAVLGRRLEAIDHPTLKLKMITNRGVKVYPDGFPETFCTDHWRCRFTTPDGGAIGHADVIELLRGVHEAGLDFIKTEHLCAFDGEKCWSLGQGE